MIEALVFKGCVAALLLVAAYVWGREMVRSYQLEAQLAAWRTKPLAPVVPFPRRESEAKDVA